MESRSVRYEFICQFITIHGWVTFFKSENYEVVKLLYREYPPHSFLNYIWASKKQPGRFIPNPYSVLAMMIPVTSGQENVSSWQEYAVNIVKD